MEEKMERIARIMVILFFSLFLFGNLIAFFLQEEKTYSYYENRNLAKLPEASKETLSNGQWGSDMESYLVDHTTAREIMLTADTWIDLNVLYRPVVNDVVVGENCLLPCLPDWMEDTSAISGDVAEITANLSSVDTLVSSYGGQYYYVAVPCQYVCHQKDYPWYLNNRAEYTAESVEQLTKALGDAGISFVDIGVSYAQRDWDPSLSSAVDNHYSIEGAYLTYQTIMERICNDRKQELPLLEEGNYTITELPNPYLGSRMRKLLDLWSSDERLKILTPKEEIPFTRLNGGTEEESYLYRLPETEEEDVLYSVYMGGDQPFTVIDTHRPELPSILVYGDSFTNAAESLLYYGFDKMYSFDFRYYHEKSLGEVIMQYQPDVVVCIRDYEALLSTDSNGCGVE